MGHLPSFSPLYAGQPAAVKKLNRIGLVLLMVLGWALTTVSLAWPEPTQPIEVGQQSAGPLQLQDDSPDNGKRIRIGVLAKRGRAHCLYQWGPTAAYLSQQIPEFSFSILPLDFSQIYNAVENQTVDFIFANSSFYVELEVRFGVTRIATLNNLHSDKTAHAVFAGVVFTRKDRDDINNFNDLRGKAVMAVDKGSLGGWHMQWHEMKTHGIDPIRDFKRLRYGGTHDAVVYAVRDKAVDAGCVRSDTLERMAMEGKITLQQFKMINPHGPCDDNVRFLHSTRHYPEWPFAKARHTNSEVAKQVAVALMRMPASNPAAISGKYGGWTIPQNYQPVHECLMDLRLPPYQYFGQVSLADFWRQYRLWLLGTTIMLAIIVVSGFYALQLKSRLKQSMLARQERERAQTFLQTVIDGFPEALMVINKDYSIALANRTVLAMAGARSPGINGLTCHQVSHASDHPCMGGNHPCPLDRIFETQRPVRLEHVHRDDKGEERFVEIIAAPIFDSDANVIQIIESWRDITERKKAEAQLRKSEEKYRRIFENSIVGFFQSTPEGRFLGANAAFAKMLGYDHPDELINSISDISRQFYMDPKDRRRFQSILQRNGLVNDFETKIKRKDGSTLWITNSTRAYFDEDGQVMHYEGVVSDISKRRQAEQALRESEQRFRHLFDNMRAGAAIYDSPDDGRHFLIKDLNTAALSGARKKKDAVIARDVREVFPLFEDLGLDTVFKRVWETGRSEHCPRSLRKEGRLVLWVETFICKLPSGELVAIYNDATARRQAEESKDQLERQIQQAQKMEAIGTLAGGIAHDFNNILSPLIGYAEILKIDLPTDNPMQKYVDQILKAALRSKDLVTQILAFSRQKDTEMKPLSLQPIVKEVLKLLRSSIPTTNDIEPDIDPNCKMVIADPTQVHQIVMNLATNAYHAMEENGGKLNVSLKQIQLNLDHHLPPMLLPGQYACLTVADTGSGIHKENLDKVFDPYFTTKKKGKGTGLGLAVVKGIVNNCKGDVRIHSVPGQGTRIEVYLPIIEMGAEEQHSRDVQPVRGGSERILLVDDEEGVAKMMNVMLQRLGYSVSFHTNCLDSLQAFRNSPASYDLVISDMTMPHMNGLQFASKIRIIRSEIPIIICTGFSDQVNEEKCKAIGIQGLVKKPVITRIMATAIREALEETKQFAKTTN